MKNNFLGLGILGLILVAVAQSSVFPILVFIVVLALVVGRLDSMFS